MILVVSDLWLPFPGGAERLIFNLARELQRRGEHVRALTGYHAAQRFDGVDVHSYPIGVFDRRDEGAAFLSGYLASSHPQLIVTHHLYAQQFGELMIETGVPVVQIVLNGKRLARAAFAVHISEWVRERADAHVDDIVLTPLAFDDVIASSHGDRIGFIKPIEHKGAATFYAIAEAMPEREFVVLRGEWQNMEDIRELPNVTFMPPVEDIREFYAQCRLLLMPSRSEDAGTVAQEATLNGLPCVSSNVDGLNETNGGGIRLDPYDVDAWVTSIRSLDDPGVYATLVRSQCEHFESTQQSKRLDEFVQRCRELMQ